MATGVPKSYHGSKAGSGGSTFHKSRNLPDTAWHKMHLSDSTGLLEHGNSGCSIPPRNGGASAI